MTSKNWRLYDSSGNYEMPPPPQPTKARPTKSINNTTNSNISLPPPPPKTPRPTKDIEKAIIIINAKKTSASLEDLNKLDQNLIQSMNVLKGKKSIEKYGKDGENGAIEISTKENVDFFKFSSTKAKNETIQDKSEIESGNQETVASKEERIKIFMAIRIARFSLEKMKTENDQAKVELEKARVALKSKLFSYVEMNKKPSKTTNL